MGGGLGGQVPRPWELGFAAGGFLLLEDLRREKNLICFMIEEGETGHPHLPAQPHPSPAISFLLKGPSS